LKNFPASQQGPLLRVECSFPVIFDGAHNYSFLFPFLDILPFLKEGDSYRSG
jgi:hypothetical protein